MGISIRHYLFEEGGALRRIPQAVADNLTFGKDAIPEYANTRQRVGLFVIENDGRKPQRILDANGSFWDFDKDGKIHEGLTRSLDDFMDVADFGRPPKKRGAVVDLVPEIKKKQVREKHRWTLTQEDLDKVARDLWPGFDGPKLEVTSVKGTAPKKPPLSSDARYALGEVQTKISQIGSALDKLTEHALKGFAFEARRTATYEDSALWEGVAGAADRQRELLAARRTGKGDWYAVVDMMIDDGPNRARIITAAQEKCASRDLAIEAGKRLMKEHIDRFSPNMSMELKIYSALEWTSDEGDVE